MNLSNYYRISILVGSVYATTHSMDNDDYYHVDLPEHARSTLSASGDPLWDAGKMSAVSPQPSPNKFFALHDLIENPDTLIANTENLEAKVKQMLINYPRYRTITNNENKTALELLKLQLERTDLTECARNNFEQLKILLDKS